MSGQAGVEPGVEEAERAAYLVALGRLLHAGVSIDRAVPSAAGARASAALSAAARRAAATLLAGRDVGTALTEAGLLDPQEAKILAAAASGTGEPGPWVERIGSAILARRERRRRLRAGMLLPLALLVAVLFLAPLPQMLAGAMTPEAYLARVLPSVAGLLLVVFLVASLARRWAAGPRTALRDWLALKVPLVGRARARGEVARWCRSMSLLLDAGVAGDRAAALASGSVGNSIIARDFSALEGRLAEGERVAAALMGNRWISGPAHELIATGEEAGRLAEALGRIAALEQERVERVDAELVRWTPRLLYIGILVWLAAGLVTGGGPPVTDW